MKCSMYDSDTPTNCNGVCEQIDEDIILFAIEEPEAERDQVT